MPALAPMRPAMRIVDAVHDCLRRSILAGAIDAGRPLSVPDLARQLDVSRSPVREAVLQLVADGLAVEQPRKGVVVATVGIDDLIEIHEIREATEGLAARLAAERATEADLDSLARILEEQARAVKHSDAKAYFRTNAAFHAGIGLASGNQRLLNIGSLLAGQMDMGLRQVARDLGQRNEGHSDHKAILSALGARDGALAEALMREHISGTRARLVALRKDAGEAAA